MFNPTINYLIKINQWDILKFLHKNADLLLICDDGNEIACQHLPARAFGLALVVAFELADLNHPH